VAVDGDGNAHVVFCTDMDEGDDAREIYYLMVDGATGGLLIDMTRITAADGSSSVRAHIASSGDRLHVVWHDKRLHDAGTGEHEVFYLQLDPGQDDQNGNAADPAAIVVVDETRLSADNGERTNQKQLAIDAYGRVHVAWADGQEGDGDRNLMYGVFAGSGGAVSVVEAESEVFDGDEDYQPCAWEVHSSSRNPELCAIYGRVFLAFSVEEPDADEIYLAALDVDAPSPLLTFPVRAHGGVASGSQAGDTFTFRVNYWGTGAPGTAELWIDMDGDGTYEAATPVGMPSPPATIGPVGGVALWVLLAGLAFLAVRFRSRSQVRLAGLAVLVAAIGFVGALGSCGGGGGGSDERFAMSETDGGDNDFRDGKVYEVDVKMNDAGTYDYKFVFEDGSGTDAVGEPALDGQLIVN
jgi:hypothetical protein